jgi:MYXO-CTERM domain-containing protein
VCTATGSWSGVRDTSGEEEIATLSSDSSYTLSCAGDGGMADASVTVRVTAVPASSSGGGAPAWPFLGLLALASMIRRRTGAA